MKSLNDGMGCQKQAWAAKVRASGLCLSCNRYKRVNKTHCERCRLEHNEISKRSKFNCRMRRLRSIMWRSSLQMRRVVHVHDPKTKLESHTILATGMPNQYFVVTVNVIFGAAELTTGLDVMTLDEIIEIFGGEVGGLVSQNLSQKSDKREEPPAVVSKKGDQFPKLRGALIRAVRNNS